MAGNNPIFQRIEKDMRSGYAGFGAAQHQQVPQDRVTPMRARRTPRPANACSAARWCTTPP